MSSSSNYYSPNNASLGADISRVSSPDMLYISRSNGAASPTPSIASSLSRVRSPTPSKRDRIRSKHPAPVHVSKLEAVLGNKRGQSIRPDQEGVTTDIGISADEVYDEYLPSGVGWVRRALIRSLRIESEWLAWHQVRGRERARSISRLILLVLSLTYIAPPATRTATRSNSTTRPLLCLHIPLWHPFLFPHLPPSSILDRQSLLCPRTSEHASLWRVFLLCNQGFSLCTEALFSTRYQTHRR